MRYKLFKWLCRNHPNYAILTKRLMFARFVLFPWLSFKQWICKNQGYQPMSNNWIIGGQEYSTEFFLLLENESKSENGVTVNFKMVNGRIFVTRI